MFTIKRELETVIVIMLLTGIILFVLSKTNTRPNLSINSVGLPASYTTPSPTPVVPSPIQTVTAESPDGSVTLTMEKQEVEGSINYSLSATEKEDNIQIPLLSKTLPKSNELSIPFNTFSPDNLDIFLKENNFPDVYYVIPVTQELKDPINVTQLFIEKFPDLKLVDITGWAAPNLLIVNTRDNDGNKASFWFEVSSQNFIRLSTGFY